MAGPHEARGIPGEGTPASPYVLPNQWVLPGDPAPKDGIDPARVEALRLACYIAVNSDSFNSERILAVADAFETYLKNGYTRGR